MTVEDYNELYKNEPDSWSEPQEIDKKIIPFVLGKAIDLGCGNGRTIKILGKDIVGVDFSEEALKIARKNNPTITFLQCDMRNVLFEPGSFDTVLSIGSHEHLNPIDFNEVHRLLNKNGLFICVVPLSDKDEGWVQVSNQHEWRLTKETWTKHLRHFRFSTIYNDGGFFVCQPI